MTQSIAQQLNEMLENDKTFSTRSGLRFMAELVRDAFQYIDDEKTKNQNDDGRLTSLENKMNELDKTLTAFLALQTNEKKKAEAERTRWRWAFLTPIIGLILTELARIFLGR